MPLVTAQVTLGSSATQVSKTSIPCLQVTVQNNAGHVCRVGDKNVSATQGAQLASGAPGGTVNFAGWSASNVDLNEIWIYGTNTDIIDIIYVR